MAKNGDILGDVGASLNGLAPVVEPLTRITIEPGKRSGQPCIRGLRITVKDVLEYLAGGMTEAQILEDFPDLEPEDFRAIYAFAAEHLHRAA
jgi:uncharacterized protein (DUF433 family)